MVVGVPGGADQQLPVRAAGGVAAHPAGGDLARLRVDVAGVDGPEGGRGQGGEDGGVAGHGCGDAFASGEAGFDELVGVGAVGLRARWADGGAAVAAGDVEDPVGHVRGGVAGVEDAAGGGFDGVDGAGEPDRAAASSGVGGVGEPAVEVIGAGPAQQLPFVRGEVVGGGHGRLPGDGGEVGAEVVAGDLLGPSPNGGHVGRGTAPGPRGQVAVEPHVGVDRGEGVDDVDGEGVAEEGQVRGQGVDDLPGGEGVGLGAQERRPLRGRSARRWCWGRRWCSGWWGCRWWWSWRVLLAGWVGGWRSPPPPESLAEPCRLGGRGVEVGRGWGSPSTTEGVWLFDRR